MLPIREMGIIVSAWVILFIIFTGCGLFIRRSFGLKIHNFDSLLFSFWVGWAYSIFFLQMWNLFFKIDWWAFLLISVIGVIGSLWNYQDSWHLIKKSIFKYWYIYLILILITLWMANRSILLPFTYDSGLYHLTSVQWATSFPIVPGLGNLHGRLAFNSSHFLYLALLQVGSWINKSYHFANGILILVLIMQTLLSGLKLFKGNSELKFYHIYYVLFLVPVVMKTIKPDSSPDIAIFILGIVLSAKFLYFIENNDNAHCIIDKEIEYTVFVIASLSVLGVTIKLSFFALGITIFLFTIIIWFKRNLKSQGKLVDKKLVVWIGGCLTVGLLVWMIRGIILSGYIAYPSTFGAFPVEWRIPYNSVINMRNITFSWARTQSSNWNEVLRDWRWFSPWAIHFLRDKINVKLPLFMTSLGFSIIFFSKLFKKNAQKTSWILWLFLLPPILSLIFWFFTAPTVRFAGASFWLLGAGSICLAINYIKNLKSNVILCIILIMSIGIVHRAFLPSVGIIKGGWGKEFYSTPQVKLKTFTTNSGLILYTPEKGDQCWDAPLPCTPYPNPDVRLRKEGKLRYGFIIEPKNEKDSTIGMY